MIALMAVLIIDGARLYALRAEMQSQVNAAASAAADASQACGGDGTSLVAMRERALAAANVQGFADGSDNLKVQAGLLEASPSDPGELAFRPTANLSRSNAALVSYSRSEPISRLLPESLLGRVTLEANAAVRKEVVATLSAAGSTVDIGGGLLGSLLGMLLNQPGYSLSLTDPDSLDNTLLRVGDLLDALSVDTLEAALPLRADRLATALRDITGVSTPVGALAEDLLGARGIETVLISDLISTVADARVPGNTQVRAYDLLISLVLNIARQQQLDGISLMISDLGMLGLPLLSAIDEDSLVLRLIINRAPTVAIGPARQGTDGEWLTRFYAPDISLELGADVRLLGGINLLGLVEFSLANLHIPLAIEMGGGRGALVSAECANGTQNDVIFGVAIEPQAVSVGTGIIDRDTGALQQHALETEVGRLQLLGGLLSIDPAVGVTASIQGTVTGEAAIHTTEEELYPLFCDPVWGCERLSLDGNNGGGLEALDPAVSNIEVTLLGEIGVSGLLEALTSLLTGLLNDVVSSLLEHLISPLLQLLGVGIGGMQISIEAANQDGTQLIENVRLLEESRHGHE